MRRYSPNLLAGFLWNHWPDSNGIRGRNEMESPAGITWNRWPECSGICNLDAYVSGLKKNCRWKTKMRRLLDMQRTYPQGPFLKAVSRALRYRLYDLNRLERIILQNIAGDYFELDG